MFRGILSSLELYSCTFDQDGLLQIPYILLFFLSAESGYVRTDVIIVRVTIPGLSRLESITLISDDYYIYYLLLEYFEYG